MAESKKCSKCAQLIYRDKTTTNVSWAKQSVCQDCSTYSSPAPNYEAIAFLKTKLSDKANAGGYIYPHWFI